MKKKFKITRVEGDLPSLRDNKDGKAIDVDVEVTPIDDEKSNLTINVRIAVPVFIGITLFCAALVFLIIRSW